MNNSHIGMNSLEIARKNDLMRSTFVGCRVIMSKAVSDAKNFLKIIAAARTFKGFTEENNPHGENNFSFFEVDGEQYFFKIDHHNENYGNFKKNGRCVLIIGRAEEY